MSSNLSNTEANRIKQDKLFFPARFSNSSNDDAFLATIDWEDREVRIAVYNSWHRTLAATKSDEAFKAGRYDWSGASREEMARRLEKVIDTSDMATDNAVNGGEGERRGEDAAEEEQDDGASEDGTPNSSQRDLEDEDEDVPPLTLPAPVNAVPASPLTAPKRVTTSAQPEDDTTNPSPPALTSPVYPSPSLWQSASPPAPRGDTTLIPHDLPVNAFTHSPLAATDMAPIRNLPPHGLPFHSTWDAPIVSSGMAPMPMLPSYGPPPRNEEANTYRTTTASPNVVTNPQLAGNWPLATTPPPGMQFSAAAIPGPYSSGMGPRPDFSEAFPMKVEDSANEDEDEEQRPRKRKKVTRDQYDQLGLMRRMEYEVAEVIDLTGDD